MMKGEQITYHNNMSYRDYQREQTRKFGGKSMADFTDEMRTKGLVGNVAGNMIDFALELATDPGFMSFAAKTIQKSAANNVKVPSGNYVDDVVSNINKREQLLNTVKNDKLKNAVNEIYRPNATVGDGGLADAVRHELSTGNLVGGKSHITKATERITNLENIINKQNLNQSDLEIAQELLDDLKNSLGGK